jgi:hypothetical protein
VKTAKDFSYGAVERATLHLASQKQVERALEFLEERGPEALGPKPAANLKSRFQMLRARLLYQLGSMSEAIKAYGQVPRDAEIFPTMVEERSWALARAGDYDRLRGDLESLSKPIYKNYFGPESVVLRSILELKLCHYQNVTKTFDEFNTQFRPWAEKISSAMSAGETPAPPWTDPQLQLNEATLARLQAEGQRLKQLETESLSAPLTAVGKQSHWVLLERSVQDSTTVAQKDVQKSRARIWQSRGAQLQEAIRKMRFVKVELMSQLSLKLADHQEKGVEKVATAKAGLQVYPYEAGEVWPDELFRIRALSNSSCPQGAAR